MACLTRKNLEDNYVTVQILSFFFLGMVRAINMGLTQNKIKSNGAITYTFFASGWCDIC